MDSAGFEAGPDLPPGFEPGGELGRGDLGVVYRAFRTDSGQEVALKVLDPMCPTIPAGLGHPNLVTVFETGRHGGRDYLVMEYVEGNLEGFIQAKPTIPEVCRVFSDICRGLEHLHGHGLAHGNLKPENIRMTREWVPKITDFGQVEGALEASDLQALGRCLRQALSGGLSSPDMRPDLPLELELLIKRLLHRSPDERHDSPARVANLLDDIAAHLSPPPVTEVELRGRRDLLDQLESRLSQGGQACVLVAPGGSGRSQLLRELTVRLVPLGVKVIRLGPEGNEHQRSLVEAWIALGGSPEELWETLRIGGPVAAALAFRRRLEGSQHTVLVVDDLDQLEPTSRTVMQRLSSMARPRGGSWLISCTPARFLEMAPNEGAVLFDMPPLGAEELLRAALQIVSTWPESESAALDPALADWLVERSSGSTRRLKMLLLSLRGRRALEWSGGQWRFALSDDPKPDGTLGQSILWLVDRLDEASLKIIRAAALLDEPMPFSLLQVVSGLNEQETEEGLERLLRAGLLEEMWTAKGDHYQFSASEIREALGQSISERAAVRLHAKIAAALEGMGASLARRGFHLAGAQQYREALELLLQAGEQSQSRGAFSNAYQLWEVAAQCAEVGGETHYHILARAAECLVRTGRLELAENLLRRGLGDVPEVGESGLRCLRWLTWIQARGPALSDARGRAALLELCQTTLKRWAAPEHPEQDESWRNSPMAPSLAGIYLALGMVYREDNQLEAARQALATSRTLLQRGQDLPLLAYCLLLEGTVLDGLGQPDAALAQLSRSLSISPQMDVFHRLECLHQLGRIHGHDESALVCYREALALADELGERRWQSTLLEALGQAHCRRGELRQGADCRIRALQRLRPSPCGPALLDLGQLLVEIDDHESAEPYLREAIEKADSPQIATQSLWTLGWSAQVRNQQAAAAEWFGEAALRYDQLGDRRGSALCWAQRSACLRGLGELAGALKAAEKSLIRVGEEREWALEQGLAEAALGLARLKRNQGEEYTQALRHAHELLSQRGNRSVLLNRCHSVTLRDVQEALAGTSLPPPTVEGPEKAEDANESVDSGAELHVTGPDGVKRRIPMRRSLFVIGSSSSEAHLTLSGPDIAERQLSVRYRRGANGLGTFFLTNLDKAHSILVNGVETVLSPLEVGDRIEVAGHHLQLCQAAETVAWLEGYTDRNPGRIWELPPVDLPVGRRGTRVNRIEVDDQTVSRSHATLRWVEGQFHLEQESSNATKINGEHLLVGQSQALADGDLVQFGLHLFRFRVVSSNAPQLASISVLATDLQCSALRGPTTHRAVDQVAQALGNLVGVLEGHGACLLPFMGERMVAVFRQDDHPARALKAAREIMRRARLPVCAGLHSGEMAVVSSHLHFRDCEEVARAAERMVAGRIGTTLIVSGATLARLHEQPEARRLDDVREGPHTLEVYQISL